MVYRAENVTDWKPVRRGAIYCSPSCGYECTWASYQKIKKEANALAKKLGTPWEAHVWENLGWHGQARIVGDKDDRGDVISLTIHYYELGRTHYSCILDGRYVSNNHDPFKAIFIAAEQAREAAKVTMDLIKKIEPILKKRKQ